MDGVVGAAAINDDDIEQKPVLATDLGQTEEGPPDVSRFILGRYHERQRHGVYFADPRLGCKMPQSDSQPALQQ